MGDERDRQARVKEPNRKQGEIRFEIPEDTLPPMHPARVLWNVVETLDLGRFLRHAKAVGGRSGRDTLSPAMKLTLWLYAISQGIGSSREIERLVRTDDAFRWVVGDLRVGHHTLSGFRAGHGEALDALMTDILASLMHKGVLSLELVAQDGMRVRAAATAPSFRSYGSLLECRQQAALHLKAVLAQADDFQQRVEAAIATVQELQATRKPTAKAPRASMTDAEARVMKMADGGFRPALNVQLATAGSPLGGPRTIVGVRLTNLGSDMNAITPMLDDIERRLHALPKVLLADANHGAHDGIRDAALRGVELLVAVPESSRQPTSDKAATDGAIVAWRARMETDEAKKLYKARASLCELMNAHLRTHHGVDQFLVRSVAKATNVVLLGVIASNILQHAATLLA